MLDAIVIMFKMLIALVGSFAVMLIPFILVFLYRWLITMASNALANIVKRNKVV